ncbi:hypothetical protein ABI59_01825 [Acidobacteria bacterium Mor1]|nr:hypothetical protein ABI59_01825 [Acidobacteria bacterium Mor1]
MKLFPLYRTSRPGRRTLEALAALLILLSLLAGCGPQSSERDRSGDLEIRTYPVPAEKRIKALQAVRALIEDHGGNVTNLDDSSLTVTAPLMLQQGVAEVIATVAQAAGETAPQPGPTTLSYWAVMARPSTNAGSIDSLPARIGPALSEVSEVHGGLEFRLVEELRLGTYAGSGGQLHGSSLVLEQRVVTSSEKAVIADVDLRWGTSSKNRLATRVRLEPGSTVVMGQAGYAMNHRADWKDSDSIMLLYLVSADLD